MLSPRTIASVRARLRFARTVLTTLDDYSGWAVVEQDRIALRAADVEGVREMKAHNLAVVGRM